LRERSATNWGTFFAVLRRKITHASHFAGYTLFKKEAVFEKEMMMQMIVSSRSYSDI